MGNARSPEGRSWLTWCCRPHSAVRRGGHHVTQRTTSETDRQTDRQTDGRTDGRAGGRADGRTDGRKDGRREAGEGSTRGSGAGVHLVLDVDRSWVRLATRATPADRASVSEGDLPQPAQAAAQGRSGW